MKTIFSGMQATGVPHLGNYLGAIKHWIDLQNGGNQCLYCVVDMHSITIRREPETLRKESRDSLTLYIALGLDPEKHILYFQSHVPAHAELAWILNCYTYVGELNRMTQFKEKAQKHADNINAGLYTYPVLMAADILLYQADMVPVGEDQKQHLEITRDIAGRFNGVYGDVFTIPEPYIPAVGARVMNLQEPDKKMNKSDADSGVVSLLDSRDTIIKKFKRAVTDSGNEIRFSPDKPGISNLLSIYACATGKEPDECEKTFAGAGYGTFKTAVGEAVADMLAPVKRRFDELTADAVYLDGIIKNNAERAAAIAGKTLAAVKDAVGFPK